MCNLLRSCPLFLTATILLCVAGCGDRFVGVEVEQIETSVGSETYRSVSKEILRPYEPEDFNKFKGVEIGNQYVYHRPRMIGEAVVEGDEVVHILANDTHELLETRREWRDDLPLELPPVISKDTTLAMVAGIPMRMRPPTPCQL